MSRGELPCDLGDVAWMRSMCAASANPCRCSKVVEMGPNTEGKENSEAVDGWVGLIIYY